VRREEGLGGEAPLYESRVEHAITWYGQFALRGSLTGRVDEDSCAPGARKRVSGTRSHNCSSGEKGTGEIYRSRKKRTSSMVHQGKNLVPVVPKQGSEKTQFHLESGDARQEAASTGILEARSQTRVYDWGGWRHIETKRT